MALDKAALTEKAADPLDGKADRIQVADSLLEVSCGSAQNVLGEQQAREGRNAHAPALPA